MAYARNSAFADDLDECGRHTGAETMFRPVHDLADPAAAWMLAEEAAFQGHAPSDLPDGYGLHAAALAYLLELPTVFRLVQSEPPRIFVPNPPRLRPTA